MNKKCLNCQFFCEKTDFAHKFSVDEEHRKQLSDFDNVNYISKPYEFYCCFGCFKPMQDCEVLRKKINKKPKYKNCDYMEFCPNLLSPVTGCQILTRKDAKKNIVISKWILTAAVITLIISGTTLILHFV